MNFLSAALSMLRSKRILFLFALWTIAFLTLLIVFVSARNEPLTLIKSTPNAPECPRIPHPVNTTETREIIGSILWNEIPTTVDYVMIATPPKYTRAESDIELPEYRLVN
jgi:hypothetical protein